jgi:hypothetical protein
VSYVCHHLTKVTVTWCCTTRGSTKMCFMQSDLTQATWNNRSEDRGPFLTSPLGANFDPGAVVVPQGWIVSPGSDIIPWGWCYPLGVKFSVHPYIFLNSRVSTPGAGWTKGWAFPLGNKFHPWGPGVQLRMALSLLKVCVPHNSLHTVPWKIWAGKSNFWLKWAHTLGIYPLLLNTFRPLLGVNDFINDFIMYRLLPYILGCLA